MSDSQAIDESVVRDLTAFQQRILTILAEEPRYGLAIKRELEAYYDDEVNHGRLYPNLDDLVTMGLVEKSELDKRTNEYRLTDAGLDAVVAQLEWTLRHFVTDEDRADQVRELIEKQRVTAQQ
ncbi:MAG: PadR family transcriptional regulator [Halobacteriales archaeon]